MSEDAYVVRWLIVHDPLDELALLVHPIAVAKGQRLFEDTGTGACFSSPSTAPCRPGCCCCATRRRAWRVESQLATTTWSTRR